MKRHIALLLCFILLLTLAACSKQQTDTTSTSETTTKAEAVTVDENLITVEVTVPASFFDETDTPESIQASAQQNGFISCTINEDGSVTYKMTKAKRNEMLGQYKQSIDQTIQEYLAGGEDAPSSFREITYNDNMTEFNIKVDRAAYDNSFDAFYALGFYMFGGYYQIFAGIPQDQVNVVVNYIDQATGETFSSSSLNEVEEGLNELSEAEPAA